MWAVAGILVIVGSLQASGNDALSAALAREQAGDDAGAMAALSALSRQNPSWELPHIELARLALKHGGGLDLAEYELEIAGSLAPENPRAQFLSGQLLEERGKAAAAKRAYARAVLFRPAFVDARFRLAGLCLAEGDFAGAAREYQEIKRLDPTATQARLQLAQVLERQGKIPQAEAELLALHREQPASKVVTRRLAELYERTQRPKPAARLRRELEPAGARHLRTLPKSRR